MGSLGFPRAFSEAILNDFGSILAAGSLGRVTDLIAFGLCLEFLLEIPDGFQSVFEGSRVHTCFGYTFYQVSGDKGLNQS